MTEQEYLARVFPEEKYTYTVLRGEISSRRYGRVSLSSGRSFILCKDTPSTSFYWDYPFYQMGLFLSSHHMKVPQVHHLLLPEGFILQEDFGDESWEHFYHKASGKDRLLYGSHIIQDLVQLAHLPTHGGGQWNILNNRFYAKKFFSELKMTHDFFMMNYLKRSISHQVEKELLSFYEKVSMMMMNMPQVFTHRDFHSRNILIHKNTPCYIDFQDARKGPYLYDLASFIEDAYMSYPQQYKSHLLSSFKEKSSFHSDDYELCVLQRTLKAIGSFCWVFIHRGTSQYLSFIPKTLERSLESLQCLKISSTIESFLMDCFHLVKEKEKGQ